MCRKLLANTVIENFRIEREAASSGVKSAVIVFPGSNCDRDLAVALEQVTRRAPAMVWHRETELPEGLDLIAVPGGFSYGDYLRSGAMAAQFAGDARGRPRRPTAAWRCSASATAFRS